MVYFYQGCCKSLKNDSKQTFYSNPVQEPYDNIGKTEEKGIESNATGQAIKNEEKKMIPKLNLDLINDVNSNIGIPRN